MQYNAVLLCCADTTANLTSSVFSGIIGTLNEQTERRKKMNTVTIVINTDNAAFEDNPNELSDILESIAIHYKENGHFADYVYDSNGNNVGMILMEK